MSQSIHSLFFDYYIIKCLTRASAGTCTGITCTDACIMQCLVHHCDDKVSLNWLLDNIFL